MAKSSKKSTKPKVDKAEKEAKKAETERLKNSREYAELAGLLTQASYKKMATVAWINKSMPASEPPVEKVTAKERERFILALVREGKTQKVINGLKDLPSREYKDLFAELAALSPTKATERLKALTATKFASFCSVNGIEPVRTGAKQGVSKAKTIPKALEKLKELGEYLRL